MTIEDRKVPPELVPYLGNTLKWLAEDTGAWGNYRPDNKGNGPVVELIRYLNDWISFCSNRRVLIQAGGNQGMYPKAYSHFFEQVYTFEPDPISYDILTQNIIEPNVKHFNKGLSDKASKAHLYLQSPTRCNNGTHRIVHVEDTYNDNDTIIVETITIDSLNLSQVDLIHLDVEGHEDMVISGAIQTIESCMPVIISESNKIQPMLEKYNYVCKGRYQDYVFVPTSR